VDALKDEFASLRTGRASASLLDQIHVEAYGSNMPINQVGAISVPEPRMISVSVWDKALVISVEKAIRSAGLGLNPVTDGQNLRIPIPPLTEERRKELVKVAHKYAEAAKVAVRHVRRDGLDLLKKLEKEHKISQDDEKRHSAEVQKATDAMIGEIDHALAGKEKEIMTV
jgi:ribosome recycling factor